MQCIDRAIRGVDLTRHVVNVRNPGEIRRRCTYMAMRLFLIYTVVELAVIVALASTIGFGWTVLLLLGDLRGRARRWPARRSSATFAACSPA